VADGSTKSVLIWYTTTGRSLQKKITLSATPRFSKWSLSPGLHTKTLYASFLSPTREKFPRPSQPPCSGHPRDQYGVIKGLIMQPPPASCYLLPLRHKYLPQQPTNTLTKCCTHTKQRPKLYLTISAMLQSVAALIKWVS